MKKLNLKKNLPTILTAVGVIGAAGVGVSAAIAQHKVEEEIAKKTVRKDEVLYFDNEPVTEQLIEAPNKQELLKIYAKHYWPTAAIFALTATSMIASNKMSQKRYNELLGAYMSLGAGFMGYREAVVEKYGEEVDKELCEESTCVAICDNYINLMNTTVPGKELLFREPITGKFFRAQERDLILAEYHLNRNFVLRGDISLAELFYFIGITPNDKACNVGWNIEDGYYWIDLHHEVGGKKNGETYYNICYLIEPTDDYLDCYNPDGIDYYMEDSYAV